MPLDRRAEFDVTPIGSMDETTLASYAQSLVGKKHTDAAGKVIGEVRAVRMVDGRLIAEVKLPPNVILG